jgi:ubiquinone/menaquinone biosynthesis C-methylase UbiE
MRWFGWLRRKPQEDEAAAGEGVATGFIAGRVRVRGVPYNLPRDLEEMNRLDFQHFLFRAALKGNYVTPIGKPASILDVGTGTGRWAREMAQEFPRAKVVGLDVNPPPVDESVAARRTPEVLPPNYRFVAGNLLEGLPFADGQFDFVHMRLLVSGIPHEKWLAAVQELALVTRRGGWVESVEALLPVEGGAVAEQLMDWIRAISLRRGVEIADAAHVGELMQTAGLVKLRTGIVQIPCGDYGGRIGKMMAANYFSGVKAVGGIIAAQGLASQAQFEQTLTQAMQDIDSPRYRCVFPVYIACGQRAS